MGSGFLLGCGVLGGYTLFLIESYRYHKKAKRIIREYEEERKNYEILMNDENFEPGSPLLYE